MSTTKIGNAPVELRWIEEDTQTTVRPEFDDFVRYEPASFGSVFLRKCADNMFVPIGLLATTACLTLGLINLQKGDVKKQQFYMRGRVLFQGLTLVAMTAGVLLTAKKRKNSQES